MRKMCIDFEPECDDKKMEGHIYKLDEKHVEDIRYVLLRRSNREVYDKSEHFVRKNSKADMPSQGTEYMAAFGQISSFSMFVFIMFFFVEKHQHFAK